MTSRRERLELRKLEAEVLELEHENAHHAHRVYTFSHDIHPSTVRRAITTIDGWARRDPNTPIELVLTSPGGYVFDGLAFYDFLAGHVAEGVPITVRALGYVASMATVILQAGTVRSISPNSWLMIHEVATGVWGKTSELRDEVELSERLEERLLELLAERSTLTAKQIRQRSRRRDWWIPATEAARLGLVDEVR
jgi:ATP-dependent Clp endopeptidase proteolytic subunit ClpP